jgi:hypothetical protein
VLDLPAVLQLSSDQVELLLLTALAKADDEDVSLLCRHAAAANLTPAAVGRVLAAAVQLSSNTEVVDSILVLPWFDAVTFDDILPALRAAIGSTPVVKHVWRIQSYTLRQRDERSRGYFPAIIRSLHTKQPQLVAAQVLPEALRMAVVLQRPKLLQSYWELGSGLGTRSAESHQSQFAAVAVCAVLCGFPAAIQRVVTLVLACRV